MAKRRGIHGKMLPAHVPEWEPLLDFAPDHIGDFMWMFCVELKDRTRLQAYKHYWTRNYLHLDHEGRAFVYIDNDRYEEWEPRWLLARVLDEHMMDRCWHDPPLRLRKPEPLTFEWAPTGTRNGVSHAQVEFVVERSGLRYCHRGDNEAPRGKDFRRLYVGLDAAGTAIEVAAIWREFDPLFVFHAAELRDEYRGLLARGERWQG